MASAVTGKDCNSGEDIKAAIAKGVELRALHAALKTQRRSPTAAAAPNALTFLSSSSTSPPILGHLASSTQYSAQTYPVFTPSYGDEPLPRYQQRQLETQTWPEWEGHELGGSGHESFVELDHIVQNASSSRPLPPGSINSEPHSLWKDDANHMSTLQTSPATDVLISTRTRNNPGNAKSINKYSHAGNGLQPTTSSKVRGTMFSWLPGLRKRDKTDTSTVRTESEDVSQVLKNMGITSIEMLKKELIEAIQKKDAALKEVGQTKNLFGDLKQKLENLEAYCEELKRALRKTPQPGKSHIIKLPKTAKLIDGNRHRCDSTMPVTDEVMVEGFSQIASEARLSVKHFCKALIVQVQDADAPVVETLNLLLQPHKLSLSARYSKTILYHIESIVNQQLYQDFENCVFQRNGSPKLLDPQLDRQAHFSSFVALRNLNWNRVLKKGTMYYSEEFSKFCDQKMSCIIATLNMTRKWPEQLLQSFFVAAKCIWLLHLLAFSFYPPLMILRVEENRLFNDQYMEDMLVGKVEVQSAGRVKVMVMPGFYVQDKILRCKVLCKYKNVP